MMNENRQFQVKTASGYFCLLRPISRLPYVLICLWKTCWVIIFSEFISCYSTHFFYHAWCNVLVLSFQGGVFLCNLRCSLSIVHCATSIRVGGVIPHGVTGIFLWHNTSGRIKALGLTQTLTEMSTSNIHWRGKGDRCVGLTTLPLSCDDRHEIWEPQNYRKPQACPGLDRYFVNLVLISNITG